MREGNIVAIPPDLDARAARPWPPERAGATLARARAAVHTPVAAPTRRVAERQPAAAPPRAARPPARRARRACHARARPRPAGPQPCGAAAGARRGARTCRWARRRLRAGRRARRAHATRQSVRTLQRRLAAHGTTASALARRVRMRDATVAIASSLRPLTEIAHAYGFSDAAHLAREFRAASGMPPSVYRAVARAR
ncbi:helix-turn-helix transcriptional regulator [Sorangium sp. So ce131]|uniref:helix-turn-helix transcriptional regulator n=1 Tax=Sorangium sp. So ce131 TaxID=3133282 RepID=UPI003F5ECBD8